MENSEQQIQIINLGKLLVKELGLDTSNDTLSRWIAHYIAEKILIAEGLPSGNQKDDIEKDCFETILKLWKHRWLLPSGKRPLEDFEPILNILEKLNPENVDPFFYRFDNHELSEAESNGHIPDEINGYIDTVLQVDRVARLWIDYLLHQAALKAKDENTEELLKNAVNLADNDDTRIIHIILNNNSSLNSENYNEVIFEKNYQVEKLKKRIEELEKFAMLNEFILDSYKKEFLNEK